MEAVRLRSEDVARDTPTPLAFNVMMLMFLMCLSAHKGPAEDKYRYVYVHFIKCLAVQWLMHAIIKEVAVFIATFGHGGAQCTLCNGHCLACCSVFKWWNGNYRWNWRHPLLFLTKLNTNWTTIFLKQVTFWRLWIFSVLLLFLSDAFFLIKKYKHIYEFSQLAQHRNLKHISIGGFST